MTKQISMATRKELVQAVGARYRRAPRGEKQKNLDEFVALTGYHRKHVLRILSGEPTREHLVFTRDRIFDETVRQALIVLWRAADRICGKRLKVMIPIHIDAMERYGHLDLDQNVKDKVLAVSAATPAPCLRPEALRLAGSSNEITAPLPSTVLRGGCSVARRIRTWLATMLMSGPATTMMAGGEESKLA